MKCEICGENYADEFEFCPYCGTYPFLACPNCYKAGKEGEKICSNCGCELLPLRKVTYCYNLEMKAYEHLEKEEYEESKKIYEMILNVMPNLEDIRFFLAENYQILGDNEKGLEQFEKLAEINPNYDGVWAKIGWGYIDKGDLEKAEEYLLKEHELNPTECEHFIYLMYICFINEDFKKANKILDDFLSINPDEFYLNFLTESIDENLEEGGYEQGLFDINERIKNHMKDNLIEVQ